MSCSSAVPSRRKPSLEIRRSTSSSSLCDGQSGTSISRTVSSRRALSRLGTNRHSEICESNTIPALFFQFQQTKPSLFLRIRSEEHTSELQSLRHLVCRLLLEKN